MGGYYGAVRGRSPHGAALRGDPERHRRSADTHQHGGSGERRVSSGSGAAGAGTFHGGGDLKRRKTAGFGGGPRRHYHKGREPGLWRSERLAAFGRDCGSRGGDYSLRRP